MNKLFTLDPVGGYGTSCTFALTHVISVDLTHPVPGGRDLPTLTIRFTHASPPIVISYSNAATARCEYDRLRTALAEAL